jgi:manganese transport protein
LVTVLLYGERGSGSLLILSQVVLSLQLPFAVIPLILFASDKRRMGRLAIGTAWKAVAWPCAVVITLLNVWLLWQTVASWF